MSLKAEYETEEQRIERETRVARNKALYEKYGQWVLLRNVWTGKIDWDDPEVFDYSVYDELPNGWAKAFGMEMIDELGQAIDKKPGLRDTYFTEQIKEKFGALRWYDNGTTKEMQDIIGKYEHLSQNICISCGRPDVGTTRGWITPQCEKCYGDSFHCRHMTEEEKHDAYIEEVGPMGEIKFYEEDDDFEEPVYEYYNRMADTYTTRRYSPNGVTIDSVHYIKPTADKIRAKWNKEHPEDPVEIKE